MTIATAPKVQSISEAKDPKKGILEAVGDISEIEVCRDWVLLGTYISSDKTTGGIFLPSKTIGEDEFQGKVGLILKMGPLAFKYEDYVGPDFKEGDWVVYTVGDTRQMGFNDAPCRMIKDDKILMRIANPRKLKVF